MTLIMTKMIIVDDKCPICALKNEYLEIHDGYHNCDPPRQCPVLYEKFRLMKKLKKNFRYAARNAYFDGDHCIKPIDGWHVCCRCLAHVDLNRILPGDEALGPGCHGCGTYVNPNMYED